jgi:hypothetical protein
MPYFEASRPMPLSFILPNGCDLGRDDALVDPDDAVLRASATRQMRPIALGGSFRLVICVRVVITVDTSEAVRGPW